MKDRNFNRITEIAQDVLSEIGKIFLRVSFLTLNRCVGNTRGGTEFDIKWSSHFLILQMSSKDPTLVGFLEKVVGYKPFCQYFDRVNSFVEWDKKDSNKRFAELEIEEMIKGTIKGLKKINL